MVPVIVTSFIDTCNYLIRDFERMNLKDNCAICRFSMLRGNVLKVLPCNHFFHVTCSEVIINTADARCPLCRVVLEGNEPYVRKIYKKHLDPDRKRIVACANKGEDWVRLASTLNINFHTAYEWIKSGRDHMFQKGGKKPRILSEQQVDRIIEWVEEDCSQTLKSLREKVSGEFNVRICLSTLGNYLEGRLFTLKQVHKQPVTMNSNENKMLRAHYVRTLNDYIQQGKQIVWIDETNFNLFCRRCRGRSRVGNRAVQLLPAARGPNIHLIGGMSAAGIVAMDRRRGSFNAGAANEWILQLMQQWENGGNQLVDLVIVCDNAPCHARLATALNGTAVTLLKLAPYSPMLNPIETIWSKIKTFVKNTMRIPDVAAPGVMEQRLVYLENIVDEAKNTIAGGDCARAVQHSSTFHGPALALEDMPVGR